MLGIRYCLQVQNRVTSITNYGAKTEWDGRMMRAQCHKAQWLPDHRDIPYEGCLCGFYSFSKISDMDGLVDWIAPSAVTVLVEAYGKVIICKRGFRAEYMKPVSVIWPLEISETRGVSVMHGSAILTHWEHYRFIVPELDLAIKASKIMDIPLIKPADAQYLIQ